VGGLRVVMELMREQQDLRSSRVVKAIALGLLLVGVSIGGTAWAVRSGHKADRRVCFSREMWRGEDRYRPCVEIVRVENDGAFKAAISDASGTVRYSVGLGNPSRSASPSAPAAPSLGDRQQAESP
jgi:hypothetical protein